MEGVEKIRTVQCARWNQKQAKIRTKAESISVGSVTAAEISILFLVFWSLKIICVLKARVRNKKTKKQQANQVL